MHCPEHNQPSSSGNTILIIGAGRFGRIAAQGLKGRTEGSMIVVDRDPSSLLGLQMPHVNAQVADGVDFLIRHQESLSPSDLIVPAVPIHLAFVWLTRYLYDAYRPRQVPVPEELKSGLPFTWSGKEGSLLVSYADFRCPEDCPEPPHHCTVTGKRRALPLYELLARMHPQGYGVHIIRSRQLAPGIGGYTAGDLKDTLEKVKKGIQKKWIIGTACRCHGTLSAMELHRSPGPDRT